MKRILTSISALLLAAILTACGGMGGPAARQDDSGSMLDSMPEVTVPDIEIPEVGTSGSDNAQNTDDNVITDQSGDFVYEGKLQQIGDDTNGYIQVPLGYLPFQDEDVQGLTQYSDVTGKNIVTLQSFKGTDYKTAAENLRNYLSSEEDLDGLTGATVQIADYNALQLYGHYADGFFIVIWLIEDPANPADTYYLALEFDSEHQYLMACSSTFQTPEDHAAQTQS